MSFICSSKTGKWSIVKILFDRILRCRTQVKCRVRYYTSVVIYNHRYWQQRSERSNKNHLLLAKVELMETFMYLAGRWSTKLSFSLFIQSGLVHPCRTCGACFVTSRGLEKHKGRLHGKRRETGAAFKGKVAFARAIACRFCVFVMWYSSQRLFCNTVLDQNESPCLVVMFKRSGTRCFIFLSFISHEIMTGPKMNE